MYAFVGFFFNGIEGHLKIWYAPKKLVLKRNEMLVCYFLLLGWWWKFVRFCSADKINSRFLSFQSVTDIGTTLSSGILEILDQTRLQTIIIRSGDLKGEQCNIVTEAIPVLAELQFKIINITHKKKLWKKMTSYGPVTKYQISNNWTTIISVQSTPEWKQTAFEMWWRTRRNRISSFGERTSPMKPAGVSVQSTTGSRGVRISGSNAGYTMFRGSVKGTGYLLHSSVSPSLPLPCVTECHHISTGLYRFNAANVGH
jgi:hypothetical protein